MRDFEKNVKGTEKNKKERRKGQRNHYVILEVSWSGGYGVEVLRPASRVQILGSMHFFFLFIKTEKEHMGRPALET